MDEGMQAMTTYKDLPENNHFSGQRFCKENKRSSMFGLKKNSSSIHRRANLEQSIQITGFRIFLGTKHLESSNNIICADYSRDSSKDFHSFNMKISEPLISRVLLHTSSFGECCQGEFTKQKESENDLQTELKSNVEMYHDPFNESNYTIKLETLSYKPQTNFWRQPKKYQSNNLDFNRNKGNGIRSLDEKSDTSSSFTTSSESLNLGNISDMSSLVLSNMKTSRLSRIASIIKNIWNNVTTNKRAGLNSQLNHGTFNKNKALSLPQRSFNDLNKTFMQNRSDIHQDFNCISSNKSNSNGAIVQPFSHNVTNGNKVSYVQVPQSLKNQTSTFVQNALAECTSGVHDTSVVSVEPFNIPIANENLTVEVNSVPNFPRPVNPLDISMIENITTTKASREMCIQIKENGETESISHGKFSKVSCIKSQMGSQDSSIRVPRSSKSVVFCSSSHSTIENASETLIKLCDDCYKKTKTAVKEMQQNYGQKPSFMNGRSDDRSEEHLTHIPANRSLEFKNLTELPIDNLPTKRKFNIEDLAIISEAVNNHLLDLKPADGDFLKDALEFLRKRWIRVVANKNSKLEEVSNYLKYFQEFSDKLLEAVILSTDREGNNALHFACGNDRFDIAEEFLKYESGCRLLKQKNKLGHSPLMVCSVSQPKSDQEWSTVKKILGLGDVNEASSLSKQTPLMNAASRGSVPMVRLLLLAGADPNLQDSDGSTALMYAAVQGHETCVSLLLEHPKCNPSIKDYDQQTACSVALAAGRKETALLIYLHSKKRSKEGKIG
ncbi:uncharacterized protein LOC129962189 [Argiope bruennichi]|uniref:uncharacterized protein LOC129962189 n=1 Tax=Argiope bruennichi TaxID=94029 RepID=UPI0024957996|nr:uncharacterized protein LOC129962189 [Argiope bruennichi]